MSGVIDENGVQWERCNECNGWVRLDSLGYQKPSKQHQYGRMICLTCANKMSYWHLSRLVPAPNWQAVRGRAAA